MPAYGFGNEPPGRAPRGIRADQPPPSQSDDMHAIRVRYCGPKTLNAQPFSLAANQAVRFDLTGTPVNALLLTSLTGQINGYFGDFTSNNGKAATIPHFIGAASIAPNSEIISIPPAEDYIFTIQEGVGGTATGTIVFMYV